TSRRPLSRRHVLRGMGACLALPLLDAMVPSFARAADSKFKPWAASIGVHPRMICCYVPNGVNIKQWMPTSSGRAYELSPTLQVLTDFKSDFTLLSGLG